MAMPEITGITKRDHALCEQLWLQDSIEDVADFLNKLNVKERERGVLMFELMRLAVIDPVSIISDDVVELIDNCR
jgi:hypothetical protein